MKAVDREDRALQRHPSSGQSVRAGRVGAAVDERGGVTPFNVLPFANTDSTGSAGSEGHGAGTPQPLAEWWVRYLCPPGGTVLDPFAGSGTIGIAALEQGRNYIGIERFEKYQPIARRRLEAATRQGALAI